MKSAVFALAFLTIFTAAGYGQNSPSVQWELVNPFRFISNPAYMDQIRDAYENSDKTAPGLELTLQRRADIDVEERRRKARQATDCNNTKKRADLKECFAPYVGWFARLAENNYSSTCWDAKARKFRKDGPCEDYIDPKSHRVRIWTSNAPPEARVSQWLKDNAPFSNFAPCGPRYKKDNCIEFDLPYLDGKGSEEWKISAVLSSGVIIGPALVRGEDRLVVGLGDSYGSGEGNPDIPARFTQRRTDKDKFLKEESVWVPRKDKGSEAEWLDRRCHRSMYSYQFKAALQMALADPQKAVTFVSFSCTGATSGNVIGAPKISKEEFSLVGAQLKNLKKTLTRPGKEMREIDYLLLSTGGNDVDFPRYVAYFMLREKFANIVGKKPEGETTARKMKQKLILGDGEKKGNYLTLHDALLDVKDGIKIKGCQAGEKCPRILLTAYPDILTDENGGMCHADRQEFDLAFGPDAKRTDRLTAVIDTLFNTLQTVQKELVPQSRLGWTVVTAHSAAYFKHGFCAHDPASDSIGEKFIMPTWENGTWQSFDPREYRSYAVRQRWIRLPVDSKMTTDQSHTFFGIPVDILQEDDRSNVIHPTAQGLAYTADATFNAIRGIQ
jgi:hypothetical protein